MRARPGLRVPGCVDGFELAVRAVVGQQVSVAGARTVLGRLAARPRRARPDDGQLLFPSAAALADADPAQFPFPRGRGEALRELARLVLDGRLDLDAGADPEATRATLLGIRGIGPWTASYVAMRALGDPDAWLPGDVGVRNALAQLGRAGGRDRGRGLAALALLRRGRALGHARAEPRSNRRRGAHVAPATRPPLPGGEQMNGRLRLVLIAGVLGAAAIAATVAIAGDNRDIRERLTGYEEDPQTISTTGRGSFHASIDRSGKRIFYKLRYSDTESPVTQAHIHFGGRHQSGGISVFLCSNLTTPAPPPETQPCPNPSGSVSGVIERR